MLPAAGQYTIPHLGRLGGPMIQPEGWTAMKTPALRQGCEQGEAMRPKHNECGESLGCHDHASHLAPKSKIDRFLKTGGSFFTGGTDLEAALVWFDDIEVVLDHMGCPLDL